eukprot:evm.model.NODE_28766_length_8251_cov_18.900740.2
MDERKDGGGVALGVGLEERGEAIGGGATTEHARRTGREGTTIITAAAAAVATVGVRGQVSLPYLRPLLIPHYLLPA